MARKYTIRVQSHRMRAAAAARDQLADHMADEGTLADFARDTGRTYRGVQIMWRAIREGLGAQAI